MRQLWADIMSHRRSATYFAAFMLVVWVVTAATWIYEDGKTLGMPGWMFIVHILLPVAAGAVVGPWPNNGVLVGALVGLAEIVFQMLWGVVLAALGRIDPETSASFLEIIAFAAISIVIGALLGAVGALLGKLIARLSGRSRPESPGAAAPR